RYTLLDTTPGSAPGDLGVVTAQWNASVTDAHGDLTTSGCIKGLVIGSTSSGTGSGNGTFHLQVSSTGVGGGVGITPIDIEGQGIERETSVYAICGGGSKAAPVDEQVFYNLVPAAIVTVPDLAYLTPDPSDPNLSTGNVTIIDSQQP